MVELQLLNFLLHHFLQSQTICIAIFNCWDAETYHTFAKIAANNYLYTQYINIDETDDLQSFENRFLKHKRPMSGAFVDMNCEKSERLLNVISDHRLFNENYHWLLYDQEANMTNFQRLFEDANLSVDAYLTYAMLKQENANYNNSSFILYDVYNNGRFLGGKLNMTIDREIICNASTCELGRYLTKLHLRHKYGHRDHLHDITWRVSTAVTRISLSSPESEILEYLLSENDTHIDPISRFGFRVLLIIQDSLGFNMTLTFRDHWSNNETHGGTIGDIVTEVADFTSTPFLCTETRFKYLAALAETGGFRSICLFRTPRGSEIKADALFKPFSRIVWLMVGVILIIAAILLWSSFIVETRCLRQYIGHIPSLLATCLISFGAGCYQGSNIVPRSMGGRGIFVSLFLLTYVLYNYYTSVVVSILLSTPVKSTIKTLGQLADSSLEVGLEPLPYTFVFLNTSKLPEVRRFVKRKIESEKNRDRLWVSAEEGIKRVREKPGYVFVLETSTSYSLVERTFEPHEICDLNEVRLRVDKVLFMQVHKNSTYKELIRLKVLRMLETGVYAKHKRQWVKQKLNCVASNYLLEVGMDYAAPLFIILLCAYVLVLILLVIELCCKKYSDMKNMVRVNVEHILED